MSVNSHLLKLFWPGYSVLYIYSRVVRSEFLEGTGYETRQTSNRDLFVMVLTAVISKRIAKSSDSKRYLHRFLLHKVFLKEF